MPRVGRAKGNRRQSYRVGIQDSVSEVPGADIAFYRVRPVGEGGDNNPLRIIRWIRFIAKVVEDCVGAGALVVSDEAVQEIASRVGYDNIPAQFPGLTLKSVGKQGLSQVG